MKERPRERYKARENKDITYKACTLTPSCKELEQNAFLLLTEKIKERDTETRAGKIDREIYRYRRQNVPVPRHAKNFLTSKTL